MSSSIRAEKLRIKGTVQGVGFRPFVFVLAKNEGLTGTVLNDGRGVEAVLEGSSEALERFRTRLLKELPPLASIESVEAEDVPVEGRQDFVILESRSNSVSTVIPADAAVCEACLKELTDKIIVGIVILLSTARTAVRAIPSRRIFPMTVLRRA